MITAEQWKAAKESKKTISAITNQEIDKYLNEGGLITRREKGGTFTYWGIKEDGTFGQIENEK